MADGKVVYEVRADDSKVDSDLNSANKKVEKGAGKLKGTMGAAALGIGAAVVAGTAAAVKLGSEFESSFAAASTLFGDVAVDVENLQGQILDLSDESGVAADELNQALYSALSAGIPVTEDMGEATEFLESATKLAKAGFTDVDTAISATAKTLNAYGLEAGEADRIQKILMQTQNKGITTVGELGSVLSNVTPTASAMGVEFEQIGAAIASMTAAGTPAAQSTTQLNSLFAELGKEGTKAQKALEAATEGTEHAGKSFQDLNAEGVPLNEILDLMGQHAEENGVGMLDMFSSIEAGKAALALSGENAEGFTENLAAMGTEADVVGEAFEKVSGTTEEQFNKALNELKNVAIEVFAAFMPVINKLLPVLSDLVGTVVEAVMPFVDILVELIDIAVVPLVEALNPLIKAVLPVLTALLDAVMPIISGMANLIATYLVVAIDSLAKSFSWLGEKLEPVFNWLKKIGETVGGVYDKVSGVIGSVGEKGVFGAIKDALPSFATGSSRIPMDMAVNVHKGERILNVQESAAFDMLQSSGGMFNGGGNNKNVAVYVTMQNDISSDYDVNRMGTVFTNKLLNEGAL